MSQDNKHGGDGKHGGGHYIVPLKNYFIVIGLLMVLTVVTVGAAQINLGHWNMPLAMLIATTKAILVMLIFMGLKYDTAEDNITFFSSFIFLAIFVVLTASDLFTRHVPLAMKPEKDPAQMAASAAPVDMDKMLKSSPELIAKGKEVYKANCVSCHGDTGMGDGVAAAALNPKPRNFMAEKEPWTNGTKLTQIVATITKGIPARGMAAWPSIALADRIAIAHWIRSLRPGFSEDTPADIAASGFKNGEKVTPTIPIDMALEKLAQ